MNISYKTKNITHSDTILSLIPKVYSYDNKQIKVKICYTEAEIFFLNATLNSLVLDYFMRKIMQDIDVRKSYFIKLPLLHISENEILSNPDYKTLMENSIKLHLYV